MYHILVVDNEADICDVLKEGFEARGNYRVRCADNRVDALAALRSQCLDLALFDVLMRENAGPAIEALAAELHVPVLRMTAHPDIVQRSREQGIPILAKPFRLRDIVDKVDRVLAEAKQLRQTMDESVHTARRLISKSQEDAAALRLLWEEVSAQWRHRCRNVPKDETE